MAGRLGFLTIGIVCGTLSLAGARVVRADVASDLAAAARLQDEERWAASESLATAALASLERESRPDSLAIAEALYDIGVARWRTVGYADGSGLRAASRSLGIRQRRLPADDLALADAHALIARFLPETGRADSARVHVLRAIDIRSARLAPDDTLIATSWDQLALIQRNSGDMAGALDSWTRAIAIRVRAHGPEHPEVARLKAQTGVPYMELGDLVKARDVLEESLGMFARTAGPDSPGRWIPLNILADVEKRSGNRIRNVDLLQEAIRVVRLNYGDDSREALTLRSNLAIALFEIGDAAGAQALLAEVLPRLEAQYGRGHVRVLNVRHGLAIATRMNGDLPTAIRLLAENDSILAHQKDPPLSFHARVRSQLAAFLRDARRDTESRAMSELALRTALASGQKTGEVVAGAYAVLIVTLVALGDTAALDSARTALIDTERRYGLGAREMGPAIAFDLAWGSHRLGLEADAWDRALESERRARERLQLDLQALPDRRALLLARRESRYLDEVLRFGQGQDADHQATAWDRLVRSRGLVRAEIERRRRPVGFESDTTLARIHERWLDGQRKWARSLVSVGGAARDSAGGAALERLRTLAEDSEADYARALEARGAKVPAIEAGLADVRARLSPDQALVSCVEVGPIYARDEPRRMVAFVTRGPGSPVDRIELGSIDDLRAAIDPWRALLAASPGSRARAGDRAERECRRLGAAVRKATWDPLARSLAGAKDVFLVEDGPLLDLPWQALPEGSSGYLVEAGPRLHRLDVERELVEPAVAHPGTMLAVGAPDFDRGAAAHPNSAAVAMLVRSAPDPCASGALPAFGALPGSGAEAEAVARAWRAEPGHEATVLVGRAASEAAFKEAASGRAILHLATHGIVAGDRCVDDPSGTRGVGRLEPLAVPASTRPTARPAPADAPAKREPSPWIPRRVWLALAGANQAREHTSDENEGFLTAEEVLTLDLAGTDWVVLSACHSGLAEAWTREGVLGMRRAFGLAGARTVIASSWAVEDAATLEWMESLYAARARGLTSGAAALESASRSVLAARRKSGRSTHPFYWAAFGASGE